MTGSNKDVLSAIRIAICCIAAVVQAVICISATIYVPADYPTIQQAIDAAVEDRPRQEIMQLLSMIQGGAEDGARPEGGMQQPPAQVEGGQFGG